MESDSSKKILLGEVNDEWIKKYVTNNSLPYNGLTQPLERVFALALGIALLPIIAVIAAAVKLASQGPAIYGQIRAGKNNAPFKLYKFRTMITNAPDGSAEAKGGAQWSQNNDPRITPLGKFLRHTHLDELPQLWNVIKGELAFVGPRPERPELIELILKTIPQFNLRTSVAPGITGWAQINYHYGASVEDAARKLEYDLYYIKNRSLALDLLIIVRTFARIFIKAQ